ncbi:MAG: 4-hydroxyphenylacetate 3-hydroxylase [Alphaproteobacteria bacterium]|nr:4-hydroxyphenylacetate 3-hydroxylase [Alphaproteobacteria bacterium]
MRDGKAYIESLKDGREVWLNGEWVKDVTQHPHLRPSIESTARLYDMQHEAAHRDLLGVDGEERGVRIGRTFQIPRQGEDLALRRKATALWMEQSCGFMGRAPDFLNTVVMAMKAKSVYFAKQSPERQQAVEAYYRHVAHNDIFLTHALNDPLPNKSKPRHLQDETGVVLRVIEETPKGLTVTGAKVVATAAAYANEAIVFPMPNNLVAGDEAHALACAVPMNAPGLKAMCRASFAHPGREADFPLSSRFDEMDSVLIFDRVFIPWERVFLHGDTSAMNAMYASCKLRDMTAHQTAVRLQVKLEFIYALMVKIARMLGIEQQPGVMQSLGEAAAGIETVRAAILASEFGACLDPDNGVFYPEHTPLLVPRVMGPRLYSDFVHKLRRLTGSTLMQAPDSLAAFDGPMGPELDRFYRGTGVSGREKMALARLAWDICGTEFGSRHVLYELFYAGDPDALMAVMHRDYARKGEHLAMFERLTGAAGR